MFEKFPSIEQYRHIVKELSERTQSVGKDENGVAKRFYFEKSSV